MNEATEALSERSRAIPHAFAAITPADPTRFDYLFPDLQKKASSLLPEGSATVGHLLRLGRAMRDTAPNDKNNASFSAAYTYLGQFVDHDITLETASASLTDLLHPAMKPLTLDEVRTTLFNTRTATLDLDSVYTLAPRVGAKMRIGKVSPTGNPNPPLKRPAGKGDFHDLPREPRSPDKRFDRAALIGDPRNDENTIVAQLHLAFLLAHNKLVDGGLTFMEARTTLRQHYQWLVLHDFLKQVCDPKVLKNVLKKGPKFYKSLQEPFYLPLEFAVAGYRFGHSMVRRDYDFNLNFVQGGPAGPATVAFLFNVHSAQRTARVSGRRLRHPARELDHRMGAVLSARAQSCTPPRHAPGRAAVRTHQHAWRTGDGGRPGCQAPGCPEPAPWIPAADADGPGRCQKARHHDP